MADFFIVWQARAANAAEEGFVYRNCREASGAKAAIIFIDNFFTVKAGGRKQKIQKPVHFCYTKPI